MSGLCQGQTLKGAPCTKRVKLPAIYCHNHKDQAFQKKEVKEVKEEKVEVKEEKKIMGDDCAICCCEVEVNDDCGLVCGHPFHLECLKQVRKPECPVCRGTITGSKLDIKMVNDIHTKQDNDANERIEEQERFARRMQEQMGGMGGMGGLMRLLGGMPIFGQDFDGDDEEADIQNQIALMDLMHNLRQQAPQGQMRMVAYRRNPVTGEIIEQFNF